MHLFNLPSESKIKPGSPPNVALQYLIPKVEVPDADDIDKLVKKGGKGSSSPASRDWHSLLSASDDIFLPNCSVKFNPKVSDVGFEIVETMLNVGAARVFSKTTTRKLTLRAATQEEAVDWIVSLKAQR